MRAALHIIEDKEPYYHNLDLLIV